VVAGVGLGEGDGDGGGDAMAVISGAGAGAAATAASGAGEGDVCGAVCASAAGDPGRAGFDDTCEWCIVGFSNRVDKECG